MNKHKTTFFNQTYTSTSNTTALMPMYDTFDYSFDLSLFESGHELNRYDDFIQEFVDKCVLNKKFVMKCKTSVSQNGITHGSYVGYVYDYKNDRFIEMKNEPNASGQYCPIYMSIAHRTASYAASVIRITGDDYNYIQISICEYNIFHPKRIKNIIKHEFVHIRQSFVNNKKKMKEIPTWNPLFAPNNNTYSGINPPPFIPSGIKTDVHKIMICFSTAEAYAYTSQCIDYVKSLGISELKNIYETAFGDMNEMMNIIIEEFPFPYFHVLDEIPKLVNPINIKTNNDFITTMLTAIYVNMWVHPLKRLNKRIADDGGLSINNDLEKASNGETDWIDKYDDIFEELTDWTIGYRRMHIHKLKTGIYIALDNLGFFEEINRKEHQ